MGSLGHGCGAGWSSARPAGAVSICPAPFDLRHAGACPCRQCFAGALGSGKGAAGAGAAAATSGRQAQAGEASSSGRAQREDPLREPAGAAAGCACLSCVRKLQLGCDEAWLLSALAAVPLPALPPAPCLPLCLSLSAVALPTHCGSLLLPHICQA